MTRCMPGKRLWFLATGTGIAPFASLMREPETYEKYEEIYMLHTCRTVAELEYGRQLVESLKDDPLIGELVGDKLRYYPTTTREESPLMGRITDNLESGKIFDHYGIAPMNPKDDRAMVCGSLAFNVDVKEVLEGFGLREGANSDPKEYVVEKGLRRRRHLTGKQSLQNKNRARSLWRGFHLARRPGITCRALS
jgi:ferredoxin--NADP+ reductase